LGNDGIYVSEEPHLTFLKDTDGDGKADFRRKIYTGFGTEDSHHALHDFVWTPDGDLLFRESIFHNSQVETPYGPIRAKNSAWFRYTPSNHKLTTFGNYPNTNPWGVTYDDWGNHVASHPIFATAFHALSPAYPNQHPRPMGMQAYSGTAGQEFIDFDFWPKEMQGGFVKARYKPSNKIEIHTWTEHDDHYSESRVTDLIFSKNLSFIPVDIRFGPRGAMYVCDWYNPIKGHAQYSLRDERRDRTSGRIWRIVPKDAKLQTPPKIDGASISELLEVLKRKEYRYRYWAKRELRRKDPSQVEKALELFVSKLDSSAPRYRHHQVEAIWLYRNIHKFNKSLFLEVLNCDHHKARAAATRQLRYWQPHLKDLSELKKRINDSNGLVRMEAVIASSYIGTKEALIAALDVIQHPRSTHLNYAITTSFKSEALGRHWENNKDFQKQYPQLPQFYTDYQNSLKIKAKAAAKSKADKRFDKQKGLATVKISCIPERMMFTVKEFKVKRGQPVKLIFDNPDVTKHNLVIVTPGAVEEVGNASNLMAADKEGEAKHFIPNSKKIIHHSKLLKEHEKETLRFKAPKKPGIYPYLCTYPGHWVIMQGVMIVE
jgi:azurin